jgi:hypothetical protein
MYLYLFYVSMHKYVCCMYVCMHGSVVIFKCAVPRWLLSCRTVFITIYLLRMKFLTPKIGTLQIGPKNHSGDFLEYSYSNLNTFQHVMKIISLNMPHRWHLQDSNCTNEETRCEMSVCSKPALPVGRTSLQLQDLRFSRR